MTRRTGFADVRDGRRAPVARAARRATWGLVAGTVLALAACSSGGSAQPAPTDVTARASTDVDKSGAPAPVVPPTWPLTGVAGEPAARAALAVKIENTAVARPQTGLEQTDVVWETIVEFDVSRFIAVFHSQVPAEVGPIRSVRPMDPVILAPMHGLLAFSGGQPGILALVQASGVQMISHDAGAPGMYRTKDRAAPHNVYGTPQTFWDQADADHQAAPGEQFLFARSADQAAAAVAGTPAGTLSFHLSPASNPSWSWDAATGTWLRSEGTVPATARSGARLSAVNVVSITADHPNTEFGAQGGAPVPTYTLVGSGDGVVASGGRTVAVRWQKDSQDAPMRLLLPDGRPANLAPGNTWVELVPAGSGSLTIG
ncbi:hypothetical protein Cch01nite_29290 [Cellulomonas chitinilytica]|uniref:DUF3048 domain-containing protein n=1 Tax=Cellulomonas chitinilytica TaxID=398759 RepID=A0A919TZW5_9CELL|nr:DUF3048 domain-containing protein [Cellulomonas chitinilytica]GIG22205.1 hypothetical protein Cch01nite_29290 [Cellulomonas chitinilytica]